MQAWQPLTLSAALAAEGKNPIITIKPLRFDKADDPREVPLRVGDSIKFSTRNIAARGHVLRYDLTAVYPIVVEWFTPQGDKRITSFAPDEFIKLVKE